MKNKNYSNISTPIVFSKINHKNDTYSLTHDYASSLTLIDPNIPQAGPSHLDNDNKHFVQISWEGNTISNRLNNNLNIFMNFSEYHKALFTNLQVTAT